jgi:hypothetical protein
LLIRTVTGTAYLPFTQHLNPISIAFNQTAFDQGHFIDDRLGFKTIQILDVDDGKVFLKWFLNPRFGSGDESASARLHNRALRRRRTGSSVPLLPCRPFSRTRADTAPDAFSCFSLTLFRCQIVESHRLFLLGNHQVGYLCNHSSHGRGILQFDGTIKLGKTHSPRTLCGVFQAFRSCFLPT